MKFNIIDAVLLAICFALMASVTIFKPLPVVDPVELCDVAQEETYLSWSTAERSEASAESTEAPAKSCTERDSAWVERMSMDLSGADEYLLAKIAYAEAGGEDIEGQALVIRVVLNRVESDEFPDSVESVIFQADPDVQFAGTQAEAWNAVDLPDSVWNALELVESGWDKSEGATYFCTDAESAWHREHLQYLFAHGGHLFFKE